MLGPVGRDGRMEPYLTTERLSLTPFTAADADLLIELDSDPDVMRYLTGRQPTPADEIREQDLPSILAGYDRWDGRFGLFAARAYDDGAFIGWFCLRPERDGPLDEVELGYRLRRSAWGFGYASEASKALLDKAFSTLGVGRVWADTMTVNRPSRKVLEKLGMSVVATLETPPDMQMVEGSEHGGVPYEITADQWQQR